MSVRVAAIGECMIELNQQANGAFALAFGGDTLNTAIYLKRAAGPRLEVDYLTALGDDPYSATMLEAWRAEGIGTARVARLAGKLPGLYVIRVDEAGERRFFYWRSAAAARELFNDAATLPLLDALAEYDLVYLSAITLSILSGPARDRLFERLTTARRVHHRQIAIDTNYRPAGWPDRATAARVVGRFLELATIALPTADDDAALFGDADSDATANRYRALGIPEVAIKLGRDGCLLEVAGDRRRIAVAELVTPVDTTAAGDAFNGAYLCARLAGKPPDEAAALGNRLAGAVIQHRGAIIPLAATPSLGL
jgi:2-dehydro-3-deoxygluconokinase